MIRTFAVEGQLSDTLAEAKHHTATPRDMEKRKKCCCCCCYCGFWRQRGGERKGMVKKGINERGLQRAHHSSWQAGRVCFSDSSPPLPRLTDAGEVAKEFAGWTEERTRDRLALQKLGGLINCTFFSLFWGGRGESSPQQLISNLENFCAQGPHMGSYHRLGCFCALRGQREEHKVGGGHHAGRDGFFTHAGIRKTERNETKSESGRVVVDRSSLGKWRVERT